MAQTIHFYGQATSREIAPPEGMQLVDKDKFFVLLNLDRRDIMPTVKFPEYTTWETKGGYVWGWSFPGWRNPGESPKLWAVNNNVNIDQ